MTTRILILPADAAADAICLEVDDAGRVLARTVLTGGEPAVAMPAATRTVLVVPGDAVRIEQLELQAHSAVQAQAAARALLEGRLARPGALHVALDAPSSSTLRTVAAVDPDTLRGWLARAGALGLRPDAAVPEQLLLPAPDDGESVHVLDAGDHWLVRGAGLAFSAEPALAARVLEGRGTVRLDGSLEGLASRALHPEVDLLQGGFAPASARARPAGRHRIAWLAAALLASPLVLVGAQALRLELAAGALESRAVATVRAALPAAADAPPEALRTHLQAAREPQAFAAASGALLAAVAGRPGTYLVDVEYQRGDRLRAVLFHGGPDDIDALRGALAADGWRLVEGGSSEASGGLHTGLVLEPEA
jgi:general secretion pathway protein L